MNSCEAYRAAIDALTTADPAERQRKKHRLPVECYAASDCEFFFTVCARQHGRPFGDPSLARAVIDALLWRRRRHGWTLYCYCLMPDHLHFLLSLPDALPLLRNAGTRGVVPSGVLDQVGWFKRFTTTQVWWKQGGRGTLWQRSSYDRALRYNDSIEAAVDYILDNPVRAGLVEAWEKYPYSAIVDEW